MSRKIPLFKLFLVSFILFLFLLILNVFISSLIAKFDKITIDEAIDDYRQQLRVELSSFEYPGLTKFIPELAGDPRRFLIVTTWRSGSSFFGQLISSIPGVYYEYEPLVDFGRIKIRGPPLSNKVIKRLYKLFYCDYYNMDDYFEVIMDYKWPLVSSKRIWNQCEIHPEICFNKEYTRRFCRLFPFHLIKVVRLRLNLVEELLANEKLGLKVVYLVRDPRGTMQSRRHADWCVNSPDCGETSRLCEDLEDDYNAAVRLKKIYPDTFRVIRYEDLALDPYSQTERIIKFLELYMHPEIINFLDTHTKEKDGDAYSTYRNTRKTPFHWRNDLNYTEVKKIQDKCSKAMKFWGYKQAEESTLKEIQPLMNYTV